MKKTHTNKQVIQSVCSILLGSVAITTAGDAFTNLSETHKQKACAENQGSISSSDWEVTGAGSLALADGNAQSLAYSLQLLATKFTATDETYLGADYFFAENNGQTTTDSLRLFGQHNRLLTERMYYGLNGSYLTDDISDLSYRFEINPLIGYHLLKTDRAKFSLEAGPGYTFEEQGGLSDNFLSVRVAQRFEYLLSRRSKFVQSLSFTSEASDFENHLITAEMGIDTLISPKWALRTSIRHQEDNTPALGNKSGDTLALVGLAYALGGFPEPEEPSRRTLKPEIIQSPIAALGWSSNGALGYSLAKGNSDNSSLTATFDTAHRTNQDEFFFNAAASYAESNGSTSIDNIGAAIQYNKLLQSPYFAGIGSGFQRDDLASLDYRFTPAVVLGAYLIKNDVSTLSVEAGPGYTFEKSAGISNDFFAVQAAERFIYALSPNTIFNQSLVYNADASDMADNFTLTANAFVDVAVTENLSIRTALSYIYDNTPAISRERHDTTLTSGFAIRF